MTLMPGWLIQFVRAWAAGRRTCLNLRFPMAAPSNVIELTELCTKHNIVDLYLWLSNRFPGSFVERDIVVKHKEHAVSLIHKGLENLTLTIEDIESLSPRRRTPRNKTAC